jgi:stage III sporulation protein AE
MQRRLFILTISLALCLLLSILPIAADESEEALTMPPAYGELEEVLPHEITDLLPDGLFSEDLATSLEATRSMTEWGFLLDTLLCALGVGFSDTVGLFCSLLGMILVASVFHTFQKSVGGRSGEMLDFCIRLGVYAAIALQTVGMVETVKTYFSRVGSLMQAMIPVMGGLYAMGGNLGEAAAGSELVLVFLSVCEYVSATVTPPVCALCMAFALMDAFGTSVSLAPLAARIKGCYTGILGLLTFLVSLALSAQSVITSRADTLGMKGIKYAVGQMLPVVGGAVAGTLGSVADGISALRGVCGVSGIILLVLLLLPALIKLLLGRFSLSLVSTVASILGCDGEAKLLTEMASLYGYLAAAVAICSVLFVLALSLLIHSGVALA